MRSRVMARMVVMATLMLAMLIAVPASAEANFSVSGSVTDALGIPLEKVRIEMGTQVAFTDRDGGYRFEVFYPRSYSMVLSRPDLNARQRTTNLSLTDPHRDEDFSMLYRVTGVASPNYVTVTPSTLALTADTWAPQGLCITASEGDEPVSLSFVETRPEGSSRYTGQWVVPEGADPWSHYIYLVASDCTSQVVIGYGWISYYVSTSTPPPPPPPDTTPPSIDITSPREGHMKNRTTDLGESPDGTTRVIGTADFRATVLDKSSIKSVFFELFDNQGRISWNCDATRSWGGQYSCDEEMTFFAANRYTFRVTAKDAAGNVSVLNREFETYTGPMERERLIEL